MVEQEQIFTVS